MPPALAPRSDYEIGKRWDLPMINIMNKDATLNAVAGKYEGMDRYECRKQLWADMEAEDGRVEPLPMGPSPDDYTGELPRYGDEGFADGVGGEDDL